jgi:ribose transport system substrate-binding protein
MKFQPLRCALLSSALILLPSFAALADTSDKTIALSNNYAGNSWRQGMLASWQQTTEKAVKDGLIAGADSFTTGENQATEQAAQIQNLILQGYNAIVIDAASPTALNGAVKQACDAGIIVVSFDGVVTEPCAYRISMDFKQSGIAQMDYLAERYPDGANVLEVRGLAGVSVDELIHSGIVAGAQKHPKLKLVGSVNGNWSQTAAQKAVAGVLPSLPKIDAVVAQGDDGYGWPRRLPRRGDRSRPSCSATARKSCRGGRNRKTPMVTSPSPSPAHRVFPAWRSTSPNNCWMAKNCPTTCSPALSVTQDTLESSLRALKRAGLSVRSTASKTSRA